MDNAEDTREAPQLPQPSQRRLLKTRPGVRRVAVVAAIFAVVVFAYGVLLSRFDVFERSGEQSFGAAAGEAPVRVYVQPITIDPVNDAMQVRISVTPQDAGRGESAAAPDQDFVLIVRHGLETEKIQISPDQARPEATFALDLSNGSVNEYPLDHFRAEIALSCFGTGSNTALPIIVTSWERIVGYTVRATSIATTSQPNEIRLGLDVRRTGAIRFFGVAAYGAMAVMALSALTISTLVFVGVRKIEVTLMGAVGAIVFALPALRNALPGAPPLGVSADILVFFWAELSAVIALGLFVIAWARRGPRP
jgi:hypothetical protein